MGERTTYKPGTFSWADLGTTDVEGAKRFYTDVFGWEPEDMPAGEGMTYTMCRVRGKNVSAMSAQPEQEREMGIPPHWNNYVTVASVNETAGKARELGGNVLAEPFDVLTVGRMAVIQDPTGAVLCLWEPRESIGAELVNEPGAMTWNDLNTPDPDGAQEFYGGLFGWRAERMNGGGIDYWVWFNGDRSNGGMARLGEDMAGIPPHWVPYFASADLGGTRSKIEAGGGSVMIGPQEVPQGASFFTFAGEFDD